MNPPEMSDRVVLWLLRDSHRELWATVVWQQQAAAWTDPRQLGGRPYDWQYDCPPKPATKRQETTKPRAGRWLQRHAANSSAEFAACVDDARGLEVLEKTFVPALDDCLQMK